MYSPVSVGSVTFIYFHYLMNLLYLSTHSLFFQLTEYKLESFKVRIVAMFVFVDLQTKYLT